MSTRNLDWLFSVHIHLSDIIKINTMKIIGIFSLLKLVFTFIKFENCESISHSVVSDSLWPMICRLPCSSVHGILQARILEWVAVPFSRGSSFLQGIFPTQGSSPGLPHCRRILYRLRHQGNPLRTMGIRNRHSRPLSAVGWDPL